MWSSSKRRGACLRALQSSTPLSSSETAGELYGNRWRIGISPFAVGAVMPDSPWVPATVTVRVQSPSGAALNVETVRCNQSANDVAAHIRTCAHNVRSVPGFTLIEALIAIALMGVILAALASITSQWLPSWNRGIARAQRSELVRVALDQLIADLGASEFITPNRETKTPLFDGTEFSVTLVRTAIGPNARPGLEIVRIAAIPNKGGPILVRATKPFAPLGSNTTAASRSDFANPIVLLRSPYLVSFAYAGR